MAVRVRALQGICDELIGCGLPAPADALRRAGFRPDAPWSWCPRCGGACPSPTCVDAGAPRGDSPLPADRPDCVVRLGAHRGALRDWVVDVKHARWTSMGEVLGALLARQLERCGAAADRDGDTVVVPVPMPWLRARERGIDHACTIARGVARTLRLPLRSALLQRHVGTQVDVEGRDARRARHPRFAARRSAQRYVAGAHAVLVDDVRTTGSTLEACARLLRRAGAARVTAAVVSVRA